MEDMAPRKAKVAAREKIKEVIYVSSEPDMIELSSDSEPANDTIPDATEGNEVGGAVTEIASSSPVGKKRRNEGAVQEHKDESDSHTSPASKRRKLPVRETGGGYKKSEIEITIPIRKQPLGPEEEQKDAILGDQDGQDGQDQEEEQKRYPSRRAGGAPHQEAAAAATPHTPANPPRVTTRASEARKAKAAGAQGASATRKSSHIRFDDGDDEHEQFYTPLEAPATNPLERTASKVPPPVPEEDEENEEPESDDDAPPEAVSTTRAAAETLESRQVATKAAEL